MLESARLWGGVRGARGWVCAVLLAAACATPEPPVVSAPQPVPDPAVLAAEKAARQAREEAEAKALLAQAETDVQRARARRALWLEAWEDLLAARAATAKAQYASASTSARRASELAGLGLEQLAYPAVK